MSWSVSCTAKSKQAAKQEVARQCKINQYFPTTIADAIDKAIDGMPNGVPLRVDANGHSQEGYGNCEIKISSTAIVEEEPTEASSGA